MEPDFLTATDYLPDLPKANLDDRTFDELVEECLLRIPRYCPEWTNYNAGDPGVTLIELFAWLVHQMLYRFNQVPTRHYVAFLELLGIRLQPPASAQTDVIFYLTKAQPVTKVIRAGTEVATVRTENQSAIVFTTDHHLVIGIPRLKHMLLGLEALQQPTDGDLDNVLRTSQDAATLDVSLQLFKSCEVGNCVYFVLDAENPDQNESAVIDNNESNTEELGEISNNIQGNILAFNFNGPAAVTTGIDPNNPPLSWQYWDGHTWQEGILKASDDKTKGFSFDKLGQGGPNPEEEGADVILHMPQTWPAWTFGSYTGHWIRCVYIAPRSSLTERTITQQQFRYERSPEITGVTVRSVGGVTVASECIQLKEELLGVSTGKPGQVFELSRKPVLNRHLTTERIKVKLPNGQPDYWQEVKNFGASGADDPHYLINNDSGTVQFGPLIREPHELQQKIHERAAIQSWGRPSRLRKSVTSVVENGYIPAVLEPTDRLDKRQYGKVPPMGAEIYMTAYRVGGGSRGNVCAGALSVLKSSIPYVKRVVNYGAATGGLDAESLNQAMIRVPELLRTRETAISPEDFERTAKQFQSGQAVHFVHCVRSSHLTTPGVVRLLIIPRPEIRSFEQGLHPKELALNQALEHALQEHLNLHRALGIRATVEPPSYVGIQVTAEVYLQPQYQQTEDLNYLQQTLLKKLYQFLNPIIGGFEGTGWSLGRAVQTSDVIALLQDFPEVRSVGQVQLFCWRRYRHQDTSGWMRIPTPIITVPLGELEMATSWQDETNPGHTVTFVAL
ncbi:MAG: putative baseplate assembly protein [Cyanobacteria bacterium P01_B01_bin.77]